MKSSTQPILDHLSIGASAICAIHCAAMPIILAMFPTLSFLPSDDHEFHIALIWLIFPLSLIAGFLGCSKHKDKFVLAGIGSGLTFLIVTAFFGHDIIGEAGEKLVTVAATILLASAHYRNYLICKSNTCNH